MARTDEVIKREARFKVISRIGRNVPAGSVEQPAIAFFEGDVELECQVVTWRISQAKIGRVSPGAVQLLLLGANRPAPGKNVSLNQIRSRSG